MHGLGRAAHKLPAAFAHAGNANKARSEVAAAHNLLASKAVGNVHLAVEGELEWFECGLSVV